MKVILTSNVESLGKLGDIKEVKNGFATNHLLPKKLAIKATSSNLKIWEQKSVAITKQQDQITAEAEAIASKLEGVSVTIAVKAGEEDKIFGSVTAQNISDALAQIGHEVSRKDIQIDTPIKTLGTRDITIKVHSDVAASIKVEVVEETREDTKE